MRESHVGITPQKLRALVTSGAHTSNTRQFCAEMATKIEDGNSLSDAESHRIKELLQQPSHRPLGCI